MSSGKVSVAEALQKLKTLLKDKTFKYHIGHPWLLEGSLNVVDVDFAIKGIEDVLEKFSLLRQQIKECDEKLEKKEKRAKIGDTIEYRDALKLLRGQLAQFLALFDSPLCNDVLVIKRKPLEHFDIVAWLDNNHPDGKRWCNYGAKLADTLKLFINKELLTSSSRGQKRSAVSKKEK